MEALARLPLHEVKTEVLNIVQPVERIECATIHEEFCCSPAGSDDASRIVGKLNFLEFVFAQIGEVGRANAGKERIYLEAKMNVEAGFGRGEGYHLDKRPDNVCSAYIFCEFVFLVLVKVFVDE